MLSPWPQLRGAENNFCLKTWESPCPVTAYGAKRPKGPAATKQLPRTLQQKGSLHGNRGFRSLFIPVHGLLLARQKQNCRRRRLPQSSLSNLLHRMGEDGVCSVRMEPSFRGMVTRNTSLARVLFFLEPAMPIRASTSAFLSFKIPTQSTLGTQGQAVTYPPYVPPAGRFGSCPQVESSQLPSPQTCSHSNLGLRTPQTEPQPDMPPEDKDNGSSYKTTTARGHSSHRSIRGTGGRTAAALLREALHWQSQESESESNLSTGRSERTTAHLLSAPHLARQSSNINWTLSRIREATQPKLLVMQNYLSSTQCGSKTSALGCRQIEDKQRAP